MSFDCDLFVIGGGSGGVRAARIAAAEHGARVHLAEASRMGGTCVIRGCVPKKLMIFASAMPALAAEARGYGWTGAEAGSFDWPAFRTALDAELDRLEGVYTAGLQGAGVEIHHQHARVEDAHTVRLADGTRISAKHILIAAGGQPVRPDIPGAELGLISDDLFTLDAIPAKALIIGGGFIACEYATILQGLGTQVTMVHRGEKVLRGFDEEMRSLVGEQLTSIGVDLRLNCVPQSLTSAGDCVCANLSDGTDADFDVVMFATGRAPHTAELGLEEVGVEIGKRGEIVVDRWSQTAVPSIFAVGDVTNRVNLTPVAIREGHAFADTIFGARQVAVDHDLVASAVYTRPFELGTIGLTEIEAAAEGPVEVYATSFRPMRQAFAGAEDRVTMKLLVCTETQRVLGCHIFGPEAGEMIQLAAIPITMGATKADFDRTIAVHPTLAEELVTLRKPMRRHPEAPAQG